MPGTTPAACIRLTGIDAGENQARRLLNDLDSYVAANYPNRDADEEVVAHEWLVRVFEPVVRAIPKDLRGKLEGPEVFHQLLEHRWYLSQNEKRAIPLAEALSSYIDTVLRHRRDEATVIAPITESISLPGALDTSEIELALDDDDDEIVTGSWRDKV